MLTDKHDSGEERRMLREGLADQYILAARSLVDHCRQTEDEIRSLHLRYGMTGLGRLEELKKMLQILERIIEQVRAEQLPTLGDLLEMAHIINAEIVYWSKEIQKAFEDA
ncbi:MAG: hypothetical protein ABIH23_34710 [bacterium]